MQFGIEWLFKKRWLFLISIDLKNIYYRIRMIYRRIIWRTYLSNLKTITFHWVTHSRTFSSRPFMHNRFIVFMIIINKPSTNRLNHQQIVHNCISLVIETDHTFEHLINKKNFTNTRRRWSSSILWWLYVFVHSLHNPKTQQKTYTWRVLASLGVKTNYFKKSYIRISRTKTLILYCQLWCDR